MSEYPRIVLEHCKREGELAHRALREERRQARAAKKRFVMRKGEDLNPYAGERARAWAKGWARG